MKDGPFQEAPGLGEKECGFLPGMRGFAAGKDGLVLVATDSNQLALLALDWESPASPLSPGRLWLDDEVEARGGCAVM